MRVTGPAPIRFPAETHRCFGANASGDRNPGHADSLRCGGRQGSSLRSDELATYRAVGFVLDCRPRSGGEGRQELLYAAQQAISL